MSGHTPGPWTLERDRSQSLSIYSGMVFIGEVLHEVDEPGDQEKANASLIAAAPDLLAACRTALDSLHEDGTTDTQEALAVMRLAIAKATGVRP
jgi:hypothetical protein